MLVACPAAPSPLVPAFGLAQAVVLACQVLDHASMAVLALEAVLVAFPSTTVALAASCPALHCAAAHVQALVAVHREVHSTLACFPLMVACRASAVVACREQWAVALHRQASVDA